MWAAKGPWGYWRRILRSDFSIATSMAKCNLIPVKKVFFWGGNDIENSSEFHN